MSPGIQVRHSKLCPTRSGGSCRCRPTYQANVWSAREGKRIFKTFPTLAAAKAWRTDAQVALRTGTMRAGSSPTLRAAAEAWLEGVQNGAIRKPERPSLQAIGDPRVRGGARAPRAP